MTVAGGRHLRGQHGKDLDAEGLFGRTRNFKNCAQATIHAKDRQVNSAPEPEQRPKINLGENQVRDLSFELARRGVASAPGLVSLDGVARHRDRNRIKSGPVRWVVRSASHRISSEARKSTRRTKGLSV